MPTSFVPGQQSFDDLGVPLIDVTFCVVDLETTGGSPANDAITEIGAARYRGGERIGTFQTLVNPGLPIPPTITWLTGITEAMVAPAPDIDAVLPTLREFIGDAVIVGHNVRFDMSFLNAAGDRLDYARFTNRVVDTCRLARRLVRDEVPDCRLHTLATRFALANRPCHRALDDVLATADLLHLLLERAAGYGVLGLDDLLEMPTIGRHPQAAKLKLTGPLPRAPGVYLFRGRSGEVLYVGKATNLRARVRSYFGSDDRRKVGPLLAQTARIDHVACPTAIEAAVREIRLIQQHLPPFNRVAKMWPNYAYVRVRDGRRGAAARVSVSRTADADCVLGPLTSSTTARLAARALVEALELSAAAPLDGPALRAALRDRPEQLLAPLHVRMHALARADRFEAAAELRDRAGTLARAIDRQRRCDALRRCAVVEIGWRGHRIELREGCLLLRDGPGASPPGSPGASPPAPPGDGPIPAALGDELACVAAWVAASATQMRLLRAEGGIWSHGGPLPRFEPVNRSAPVPDGPAAPWSGRRRAPRPARRPRRGGTGSAAP